MKYKAIIFDFDGVLFDSEKIHLHACNQAFHPLGFAISEEEYFHHYAGMPDKPMFDLILANKNISCEPHHADMLRKNKIIAYKNYVANSPSLDGVGGVKEFIQDYAKIMNRFAICSAATREEIDATLEKLEEGKLRQYFAHIISIDDISVGKPSPEGYLLAAHRLNISPQDCLAIEDTPVGIAAAKSAGMTVAGITSSHDKTVLTRADFVADNFSEIDGWIRG